MTNISQVANSEDGQRVGNELCALAGIIANSPRLTRALSSATVDPEAKISLLRDITRGSYSDVTLRSVADLDSTKLRTQSAFVSAVFDLATRVVFAAAAKSDEIDQLQEALDFIADTAEHNEAVTDALRSPEIRDSQKMQLIDDLFRDKAPLAALSLTKLIIAIDHGRDFIDGLGELARQAIATSGRVLADVTTAIEIDAQRQDRLASAISQRLRQPIKARFTVDPNILGSVIVQVGDEVWDGSVRNRLDQARALMKKAS